MAEPTDGLLLVDKPCGPTSHDVVGRIRRCLGQKRVGHAGTLDPMASGLLPLMLGRTTRLLRFLPHSPKHYRGTLQLGLATDTDDVTGRTLAQHPGALPTEPDVLRAAERLRGKSLQVPPSFSARKIGGRRMYDLAREGTAVEAPPTEIEVLRFDLVPGERDGLYAFDAEVSRGTYIRGLARDLGRALECGAALASLTRTRIGPLELAGAIELQADGRDDRDRMMAAVISPERIPLCAVTLLLDDERQAVRFASGAAIEVPAPPPPGEAIRVLAPTGSLLGMAETHAGLVHPRVVLA